MAHHRGRARQGRGVVQLGGLELARDVTRSGSDRNILWSNLLQLILAPLDPRGLEYLFLIYIFRFASSTVVGYFNCKFI